MPYDKGNIFTMESNTNKDINNANDDQTPQSEPMSGDNDNISSSSSGCSSASNNNSSNTKNGDASVTASMNNPFARTPPQALWGGDTAENKPILAPPKLAPPDSGLRPSVLRPANLGRLGGGRLTGPSMFSPPIVTVTSPPPPAPTIKPMFQLKPSVLGAGGGGGGGSNSGGGASNNPFARVGVPAAVMEEPADSTSSTEAAHTAELPLATPPTSGSPTQNSTSSTWRPDVSSSTQESIAATGNEDECSSAVSTSSEALSTTSTTTSVTSSSITTTSNSTTTAATSPSSMFMPLNANNRISSQQNNAPTNSLPNMNGLTSPRPSTQFIFGQNLHSRVTGSDGSDGEVATNGDPEPPRAGLFSEAAVAVSPPPTTGSNFAPNSFRSNELTGNLFSEAAGLTHGNEDGAWGGGKSLVETSRELTEKENSQKRKFEEVEVITGEESESNVLQMNCKLYGWVNGSWHERGRGILRLNDWGNGNEVHSRLVIRTQGTLTVMLNTQIWPGMSLERASQRSVRFTASDGDGQPKIFLVMGSKKDVSLLYNSLEWRVATRRSLSNEDELEGPSAKKAKEQHPSSSAEPPPYDEEATD